MFETFFNKNISSEQMNLMDEISHEVLSERYIFSILIKEYTGIVIYIYIDTYC